MSSVTSGNNHRQVAPTMVCGQVWGTQCAMQVREPDYSHGNHGMYAHPEVVIHNQECSSMGLELWGTHPLCTVETTLDIVAHPHCPPTLLRYWVELPNTGPRLIRLVAGHPRCTPSLLNRLAKHPDPQVRRAVAQHCRTPVAVLAEMLSDSDDLVCQAALSNRRLPDEYCQLHHIVQ